MAHDAGKYSYRGLRCQECGGEYALLLNEVVFYLGIKLALPKRCKACRKIRQLRERLNEGPHAAAPQVKVQLVLVTK